MIVNSRRQMWLGASLFLCGLSPFALYGAPVTFTNTVLKVIENTPDKNTGLDKIYIIYDTSDAGMEYSCLNPASVKIYKYGNLGGGYAEELNDLERTSDKVIVRHIEGNSGYIIEENSNRYYFWVVNYLPYRFKLVSVSPSDEIECDASILDIDGFAPPIHYYTINGQQRELSREIKVTFDTQKYNSVSNEYELAESRYIVPSFDNKIRITPGALAYTAFHVAGDRFLESWNWGEEAESIVVTPNCVDARTEAIQETQSSRPSVPSDTENIDSADNSDNNQGSNQIKDDDTSLGGSAPADISFIAHVSQGVMHYEWQMSRNPEFEDVEYRFNVQNIDYTFLDEGTYYVRFIGSNSDGSCESIGEVYTVSIGASELLCPNAFSPDGDGINDEWKVSYRSIIEFDCWIFDRYGAEICHFSDPQLGWDGKRGGKAVNPGVYYYVITAVGSDGKRYKKSGDINILRHRNSSGQTSSESE